MHIDDEEVKVNEKTEDWPNDGNYKHEDVHRCIQNQIIIILREKP